MLPQWALVFVNTSLVQSVLNDPAWADGTGVRGAPPLREELVRPQRTTKGKESIHSFPLSTYSAPGDLRQDPGHAAESSAEAST